MDDRRVGYFLFVWIDGTVSKVAVSLDGVTIDYLVAPVWFISGELRVLADGRSTDLKI